MSGLVSWGYADAGALGGAATYALGTGVVAEIGGDK